MPVSCWRSDKFQRSRLSSFACSVICFNLPPIHLLHGVRESSFFSCGEALLQSVIAKSFVTLHPRSISTAYCPEPPMRYNIMIYIAFIKQFSCQIRVFSENKWKKQERIAFLWLLFFHGLEFRGTVSGKICRVEGCTSTRQVEVQPLMYCIGFQNSPAHFEFKHMSAP